ncbi:unnamed protein product [Didymodactylos carnosus]|uniref:COP9 signalosome complex subunit 8 n=1 Tax=Didymodactylos carnosus TaxID=1234261 RepID=A0A8S2F809_9BILA|nr:unnamed protein product [Didymodactylos carnosus]CAF4188697.1 unnamed protein product [Didymodactylos carnosus]
MATSFTSNKMLMLQNRLLTSGDNVSIDLYKEIMIEYLLAMKTFVWENLPPQFQVDIEFQQLYKICGALQNKNYSNFYALIRDFQFSSTMSSSIEQLQERVTLKNLQLIENAYKSISFDDIQSIFGITSKVARQFCEKRGWQKDSSDLFALPCRSAVTVASNSDITKLVDMVCFLEQ